MPLGSPSSFQPRGMCRSDRCPFPGVFVMIRRTAVFALALGLVAVMGVYAQNGVKSGPQNGEKLPGPFHPLNINGEHAGKKNCLYCSNGTNPVAVVFARELTPEVSKLIKQLDSATVTNSGASMGSYAVFMSDSEKLPGDLKTFAEKAELKKLVLSVDNPAGPKAYEISKDAAVTVLLYKDVTVSTNHTFKTAGDLNEKAISKIVSDMSKIVK
jgi:hypothetical protein